MEDVNKVDNTTTQDTDGVNKATTQDTNTANAASTQDDKPSTVEPLYADLPWLKRTMTAALPKDTLAEIAELLYKYQNKPPNVSQFIKWMIAAINKFEDIIAKKQSELFELQSLLDEANDKYKSLEKCYDAEINLRVLVENEFDSYKLVSAKLPANADNIGTQKPARSGVWALLFPHK